MKKFILISFILIFGENYMSSGQIKVSNENFSMYNKLPQEKLFVHINTSFLISGEQLYYKIYCINDNTNKLSDISKIVYVELIRSDKSVIFKHKVRLQSGLAQGDFFIPISVKSGNYKLIAYTQWMRNKEENNFFQNDISIINPFNENQNEILKKSTSKDTLQVTEIAKNIKLEETINEKAQIKLKINKKRFKNREKVSVAIGNLKGEDSFGNYSISVRKKNLIDVPEKLTSINYSSLIYKNIDSKLSKSQDSIYLPELRGELISGKVLFKDSNKSASNIKVALSIYGKDYIFKVANTNSQGIFYFNTLQEYKNSNATIQVISNGGENFKIILDEQVPFDYENLEFNNFWITKQSKDIILKHSIYNQIENAYANVKKDIFNEIKPTMHFYGSNVKEYILDDYTRFSTVNETLIEIVNLVFVKQNKGVKTLHIIRPNNTYDSGLLPLILLDGQIIQDHDNILDFDVKKLEKISVVREKYIYGSQLFEGIVSFETIKGDYENIKTGDYIKNITLFKPITSKSYFKQEYDGSNKLARIPDYRNQLLWQPNFKLSKDEETITFFTSDNNGDYEICIEGFTNEGKPVSLKEMFSVE